MARISIQREDFSVQAEYDRLRTAGAASGAIVTFTGLVRDFNRDAAATAKVQSLTLQHYPGMTEKLLADIVQEAKARWALDDIIVIHRVGELQPNDQIVLVAVSSAHRREAFEAAEFIMDYLKTRATFWKKVRSGEQDEWVEMHAGDQLAASRWQENKP